MRDLVRALEKEEEKLLDCVHCGFCLPACPTYTRLGDEADSPRGRLHFMRAVVEDRLDPASPAFGRHLDRCLGCRACESVCPSGVEYGHLLEGAREVAARARPRPLLDRILASAMARPSLLSVSMALARALRATGFPEVAAQRLPDGGRLGRLRLGMGMVAATRGPDTARLGTGGRRLGGPPSPERGEGGNPSPPTSAIPDTRTATPAGKTEPVEPGRKAGLGKDRPTALLLGCVQEGLLGRVNRATARVLEANGYRVVPAPNQGCCGAIHAHTGNLEGARELARANVEAFRAAGVEIIAVNAAGCGAVMKEYPLLLEEDPDYRHEAEWVGERVKDVSELLHGPRLRKGAPVRVRVTYDAPCHLLHAQGISREPLSLLSSIPGLELAPLEKADECCGGAGIYGITHPELGGEIGGDKVRAVLATGARVVATGNPGCMMQIGAGLRMAGSPVEVMHPVELLDESYRRAGYYEE